MNLNSRALIIGLILACFCVFAVTLSKALGFANKRNYAAMVQGCRLEFRAATSTIDSVRVIERDSQCRYALLDRSFAP